MIDWIDSSQDGYSTGCRESGQSFLSDRIGDLYRAYPLMDDQSAFSNRDCGSGKWQMATFEIQVAFTPAEAGRRPSFPSACRTYQHSSTNLEHEAGNDPVADTVPTLVQTFRRQVSLHLGMQSYDWFKLFPPFRRNYCTSSSDAYLAPAQLTSSVHPLGRSRKPKAKSSLPTVVDADWTVQLATIQNSSSAPVGFTNG